MLVQKKIFAHFYQSDKKPYLPMQNSELYKTKL